MNKEAIMISGVSYEDYQKDMSRLTRLESKIDELQKSFTPKEPEEYMTRREVAQFLKCDLSTIYLWSKSKKLLPFHIGNRVYFKRSQIISAIK
jgi:hypothetical protein